MAGRGEESRIWISSVKFIRGLSSKPQHLYLQPSAWQTPGEVGVTQQESAMATGEEAARFFTRAEMRLSINNTVDLGCGGMGSRRGEHIALGEIRLWGLPAGD